MVRKISSAIYTVLIVILCLNLHTDAEAQDTPALVSLIHEALKANPRIKAAYNEWKAAEYKAPQVSSLPDPMAKFTHFGENIETKVGAQEQKYGISQKIPFPGKLSTKEKIQLKHAAVLGEKYEAAKRELIKKIKFVYYDMYWVDKAIETTEEEKSILESVEAVAQKKYETNITPQQDVIKVQVELSKLIERLFILNQNRKALTARMNALLNRPDNAILAEVEDVTTQEFNYALASLQEMAKGSRQELQAADLKIEKAEYEKSLARLDYFPDFNLGFDYTKIGDGTTNLYNDGQDAWAGMVSVNLPIWFGRLSAQSKEKQANILASKSAYEDISNVIASEVEDLYFKITSYMDIVSLYETALLPQAEQAFQSARAAYETGSIDFLNWLDSERTLLKVKLAYYKAIADYQKSIAYLERVVGVDL